MNYNLAEIICKIVSIPKSWFVSYRLTDLKTSFRLPVLVRYNTILVSLKGKIDFCDCPIRRGVFQFGFNQVGVLDKKYERPILEINGRIIMRGVVVFGHGARISVGKDGVLSLGKDFLNSAGVTLICNKRISIGDHVLVSWDTMVMDTDLHSTIDLLSGKVREKDGYIGIGDNVWICYGATILKNTTINNGIIVSAKSLVKGDYLIENSVICGVPAKVVKESVTVFRG
jgi:acetyltransferase-like isoleucine patch superfamily enzyme